MASTIAKIAKSAGVSPGTVSRMLNNKIKGDRPAIARRIERVRQIAREMGYKPNRAARSIVTGRFGYAGFMTCKDFGSNWIPRLLLHGIHDELENIGYRLVFSEVRASKLVDSEFVPHLLRESSVDALLVFPNIAFSNEVLKIFEQSGDPLVWINLRQPRRAVYPDDAQGTQLGLKHLLSVGHRNIGYLGRPRVLGNAQHYSEPEREEAFVALMREAGLSGERLGGAITPDRPNADIAYARNFLQKYPDVTAVMCYGLGEATALYGAALAMNRRVPEDLTIMAFHEDHIPSMVGLPIITIPVPFEELGRRAVQLMAALLEDEETAGDLPSASVPYKELQLE